MTLCSYAKKWPSHITFLSGQLRRCDKCKMYQCLGEIISYNFCSYKLFLTCRVPIKRWRPEHAYSSYEKYIFYINAGQFQTDCVGCVVFKWMHFHECRGGSIGVRLHVFENAHVKLFGTICRQRNDRTYNIYLCETLSGYACYHD